MAGEVESGRQRRSCSLGRQIRGRGGVDGCFDHEVYCLNVFGCLSECKMKQLWGKHFKLSFTRDINEQNAKETRTNFTVKPFILILQLLVHTWYENEYKQTQNKPHNSNQYLHVIFIQLLSLPQFSRSVFSTAHISHTHKDALHSTL